jgi:hypothetical protein
MTAVSRIQNDPDQPVSPDRLRPSFLTGALWAGLLSLVALPVGFGSTEAVTAYTPADWYAQKACTAIWPPSSPAFSSAPPRSRHNGRCRDTGWLS